MHDKARLGLDTLQLVVFSHGNVGHRLVQSCLFRELASCGYCVVVVTHKDGSADYHPEMGLFPDEYELHDYDARNKQLKIRERELVAIID